MNLLTREELAHGRRLVEEAFDGPWRYREFRIDCACVTEGTDDGECKNPECDGDSVPATFVEAPEQYPASEKRPQVVATIEVPGLSDLAEKNGEAICWLRNQALALFDAHEKVLDLREALEFIDAHERATGNPPTMRGTDLVAYAKSLGWNPL